MARDTSSCSGKVTKKSKDSMTVLLDNSNEELTWMPDLGDTVSIDGKETAADGRDSSGSNFASTCPRAQVATK